MGPTYNAGMWKVAEGPGGFESPGYRKCALVPRACGVWQDCHCPHMHAYTLTHFQTQELTHRQSLLFKTVENLKHSKHKEAKLLCFHVAYSASMCVCVVYLPQHPAPSLPYLTAMQLRQHSLPTLLLSSEHMSGRERNGSDSRSSSGQRQEVGLQRDLKGGRKNRRGDRRAFKRQSEGSHHSEGGMRHLEKSGSTGQAGNCSCPKMIHWGKY